MASYFVATHAQGEDAHAVHDRGRCPPEAFPREAAEYLGEFLDPAQAVAVARLRYPRVATCSCCTRPRVTVAHENRALTSLRT